MTIAEATRFHALTLTPVTALVIGRVFTGEKFPQSPTLPAIKFFQIGDIQFGHLRGTARLKWARIQADCLASSIKAARELDQILMGDYAGGVATGLLGSTGSVGGSPAIRITINPESMGYREDVGIDELKPQHRTMRDYKVWIESV